MQLNFNRVQCFRNLQMCGSKIKVQKLKKKLHTVIGLTFNKPKLKTKYIFNKRLLFDIDSYNLVQHR